jgi:hypothetical protein
MGEVIGIGLYYLLGTYFDFHNASLTVSIIESHASSLRRKYVQVRGAHPVVVLLFRKNRQ